MTGRGGHGVFTARFLTEYALLRTEADVYFIQAAIKKGRLKKRKPFIGETAG